MILYTMMPYEMIFPPEQNPYQEQKIITHNGIPVIVEPTNENSYQVVRVMSSDPMHYLDTSCYPGTKLSLTSE